MRRLPIITASALERLLSCESSLVLPQVNRESDPAARGTSIHAFSRRVIAGVPIAEALEHVEEEYRATCSLIDFRKMLAGLRDVHAEEAYAYDVRTRAVRFLGFNLGRNYGALGEFEIAGTNDFAGVSEGNGWPVVEDLKTGLPVTVCAENPQMKFQALVKMVALGVEKVEARLRYVKEDGSTWVDAHVFDSFDLEHFGDELEDMFERAQSALAYLEANGTAPVMTGGHCSYCPALASCPAYVSLARTMATDLESYGAQLEMLSPIEAGAAWAKAKQIEKLLDVVLSGLKNYAIAKTFPLPNGQIIKQISYEQHNFDRTRALVMLREKGANDHDIGTLFVPHTIASVRATGSKNTTKKPKAKKAKAA